MSISRRTPATQTNFAIGRFKNSPKPNCDITDEFTVHFNVSVGEARAQQLSGTEWRASVSAQDCYVQHARMWQACRCCMIGHLQNELMSHGSDEK